MPTSSRAWTDALNAGRSQGETPETRPTALLPPSPPAFPEPWEGLGPSCKAAGFGFCKLELETRVAIRCFRIQKSGRGSVGMTLGFLFSGPPAGVPAPGELTLGGGDRASEGLKQETAGRTELRKSCSAA